jgi:hypothetical protein
MDVVKVVSQVVFVADHVIPESCLPEIEQSRDAVYLLEIEGVIALDAVQDGGKVAAFIFCRHQPVEVIRQDDVGQEVKWMNLLNAPHGFPEKAWFIKPISGLKTPLQIEAGHLLCQAESTTRLAGSRFTSTGYATDQALAG